MPSAGGAPFWIDSGLSLGTVLYALVLAVLGAVIVGVFPALRATGAQLREAMGSLGSGTKARLGPTWTALIVAQVAIAVAILPPALLKGGQMVQMALQQAGVRARRVPLDAIPRRCATWRRAPTRARLVRPTDSARAIVTELVARIATEPGVVGVTVTSSDPWGGGHDPGRGGRRRWAGGEGPLHHRGHELLRPVRRARARGAPASRRQTPYYARIERPVIVNRSFVTELIGGGDPIGRRVRYRSDGDEVNPWHTIAGVVEDFPAGVKNPGETSARAMYHLAMPGEWDGAMLTIRLRGQTPEGVCADAAPHRDVGRPDVAAQWNDRSVRDVPRVHAGGRAAGARHCAHQRKRAAPLGGRAFTRSCRSR